MSSSPASVPFGKYDLHRRLAKGGMAELFVATVRGGDGRQMVVKRILPHYTNEVEFVQMFLNEARIAAQLAHPGIIQIFDLGQESGHYYIAMELVDGKDLETIARAAGGTLPPVMAAHVAATLAGALGYANRTLNVIHRDVTPGNVMLSWQGQAKLVDFGIAKATDQLEKTRPGVVKGKFRYMSPEQIEQLELDGRTDLFSLGVLLYELTTGQRPFERKQILQTLQAVRSYHPPPPHEVVPGYPDALSRIVMRALTKKRDQRYRTGREMQQDLEAFLATVPAMGPPQLASFVRRLFAAEAENLATDPGMVLAVHPPPTAPKPAVVPPTEVISPDDARRMLAEAERRATRNSRLQAQEPMPVLPDEDFDEPRTSQISAEEIRKGLSPPTADLTPPPLVVPREQQTRQARPEQMARERNRQLAPPVPLASRPSLEALAPFPSQGEERSESTAPERGRRNTRGAAGRHPPEPRRKAPPPPVFDDLDDDELSVTETTMTDHHRKAPSFTAEVRRAHRGARVRLVLVAAVLVAIAAVVLGWAFREMKRPQEIPPQLRDDVTLGTEKVVPPGKR